jgi:hypothetical protein
MPTHPFSDDASGRHRGAPAEPPRAEPEIIPPGADFPPRPRPEGVVFTHRGGRIRVARLGPLGIAMVLLGAGVLGAIGLLVLLGAVLVGAAALGVIVIGALLSQLFRGSPRP